MSAIDPYLRYQDGQERQQSGPPSPRPHPLSHALSKSRKRFQSLAMMYHQTNLGCKSFVISEYLVETIVAKTLKIAK